MRLAGFASLMIAAISLASCGGGGGGGSGRVRSPVSTSSPSGAATPPTIGMSCSTPSDAVHAFVDSWMAGDRGATARCATPDAVATIFARQRRGATWTFQGCDGPDPGLPICSYSFPGSTARLTLHGTEANGWMVDSVQSVSN
jgi:hypothetical protein